MDKIQHKQNKRSADYCIAHSGLVVSKQFSQVEYSIKYHKINYTGIRGNNLPQFIYYQILANTLILKLK